MKNPALRARRLGAVACIVLLLALAAPVMGQEGPTGQPLTTTPAPQATDKPCSPLSEEEQAIFAKLAQINKAGQLAGADYDLFLKLSEQAACAATTAALRAQGATTSASAPTGPKPTADFQSAPASEPVITDESQCAEYENYAGAIPKGWFEFCAKGFVPPEAAPSAPEAVTDQAYAQDIYYNKFVYHTLNNFSGQTTVANVTNSVYGMDFDPTATVLYALNNTTDQLGTINLSTGAFTSLVSCPPPGGATNWTGLSIDPVSGVFYGSTTTNLYTINPSTGASTSVGAFGTSLMIEIAVNASGQMYGHDIGTDKIYTINTTNGAATAVGSTGYDANYAQGMDFDNQDGTLYIWMYVYYSFSYHMVYGTVNLSTGTVTPLATDNPYGEFEGATKTVATDTWTGATSTNWNTASNWSLGRVPTSACYTNVVIPTSPSGSRFPTLTAESWANNVTIQSSATLNSGSQTLHVCGNWANSGAFTGSTGTISFDGTTTMSGGSTNNNFNNVTISSGKSLDLGANQTLNVSGNWTDNGGTVTPNTSSVIFKGTTQTAQKANVASPVTLFSDDMESGASKWNHSAASGTDDWAISTTQSHSTSHSWFSVDVSTVSDKRLWNAAAVAVDATSTLTFWHFYSFENSTTCYDGSVLEISTDSGSSWADLGSHITAGGYNGTVSSSFSNPLGGRSAWCLQQTSWTQVTVDLSSYAGQSVQIRWRLGTDTSGSNTGWYIDDVTINRTTTIPGTLAFNNLTVNSGSTTSIPSGNLTVNGNLLVNAGGTLDVGTNSITSVGGTVTNNGTLKQTKNVAASSTTSFLSIPTAKYYGVDITIATGATALGSTAVSISGNQVCSQANGYPVKRCFVINPTTTANSTVTFYYSQAELQSGQTATNLKAWKYNGSSWSQAGTGTSASSCTANQLNCSVAVTGVSAYGPPTGQPDSAPEASTGPFALKMTSPQAVTLADFSAAQTGDAVLLTWETNSELDNRGFNLYRGVSPNGPDRQLNETLIPSQGPGSPGGFIYTWEDRADLVSGTTYFYWVEDVDMNGTATRHGPVSVDYNAPTAVRLLDAGAATARPLALPLMGAGLLALAAAVAWRKRR